MRSVKFSSALRLSFFYVVFAGLWISLSDHTLSVFTPEFDRYLSFQSYKGWLFVLCTGSGLYFLIRRHDSRRRNLTQKVQEQNRRLSMLMNNIPGMAYRCKNNENWTMEFVSDACEQVTGYPPDHLLMNREISYAQLIHEDDRQHVWNAVQGAIDQERPFQITYRIRARSGETRWVWEQGQAVRASDGEVLALEGIIMDVTERQVALKKVEQALDRLKALRTVDLAITASLDSRVTLTVLLDQVTNRLGVDAADVLLLDPYTRELHYVEGRGFRTEANEKMRMPLGEGLAGQAALDRVVIKMPDLNASRDEFLRSSILEQEDFVSYYAAPLLARGTVQGVLEVFNRTPLEVLQEWLDFFEALASQAAIAVDNARLFEALEGTNLELVQSYDKTLAGWSKALELRDIETKGHTDRVTRMTLLLAEAMGFQPQNLIHIRRGALLHDIGKLGIPDEILLKPGPLTDDEWQIMKKHPIYARDLLSSIRFLEPALAIPYAHHEHWDGAGYPRGLSGEDIPKAARIFAVVDAWDAMVFDRPYRAALPHEQVKSEIEDQAARQFDPEVVKVFLMHWREMQDTVLQASEMVLQ